MILFVKEECKFCEGLPEVNGLRVITVVQTSKGPRMNMNSGTLLDLPPMVKSLPTLLINNDLYIGKDKILPKLKELANE